MAAQTYVALFPPDWVWTPVAAQWRVAASAVSSRVSSSSRWASGSGIARAPGFRFFVVFVKGARGPWIPHHAVAA
eukprot:11191818-Lingulodinium_polyedra.AAC.1